MREEGTFDQDPRYRELLKAFRQVMQTEETTRLELYLLFLQVAAEGFADRQVFFNRFALSEGKLSILALLKTSGPLTPSELAKETGVTPGTITGLLRGLEREGLIRREEHPTDARKAAITLVPTTLTLFEQVLTERFRHIETLLSSFTGQELQQMRALLGKLHQQLVDFPPP